MSAPERSIWGPVVEGRARRRQRLLIGAGIATVLVLGLTVGSAMWANSQLPRVHVDGLAAASAPTQVLVIGSDRRDLLTPEQRRELSTGSADGQRADTIMLLTIERGNIATLAFPRDLWVRRCDGTEGRINAAVAIGGPQCLVDTIRDHAGIHAHHYIEVTFGGFRELVDAVGGVTLCLEDPISDRDAGIDLPEGCQRLDGVDALGYVRVRKIDDDLQRIQRQKQFLEALAREVATPAVMLNPVRVVAITRGAGGALLADQALGPTGLWTLARGFYAMAAGSAHSYTVPTTPRITSTGAAVLDTVIAEAEPLFAAFRTGAVLRQADAPEHEDAALAPSDVRVTVYNAAGVQGLASRIAQRLAEDGFEIIAVGNAERQAVTRILHPPGETEAAELVARTLQLTPEFDATNAVTTVTVMLGEDQRG